MASAGADPSVQPSGWRCGGRAVGFPGRDCAAAGSALGLSEEIKLFSGEQQCGRVPVSLPPARQLWGVGGFVQPWSRSRAVRPMCFLIRIFPETSEAERLFPRVFDIGVCFLGENVPSSPLPVCFSWLSF